MQNDLAIELVLYNGTSKLENLIYLHYDEQQLHYLWIRTFAGYGSQLKCKYCKHTVSYLNLRQYEAKHEATTKKQLFVKKELKPKKNIFNVLLELIYCSLYLIV